MSTNSISTIKESLAIVAISIVTGFIFNALYINGLIVTKQFQPVQIKAEGTQTDSEQKTTIQEISLQVAFKHFQEKTAVFVDARSHYDYSYEHLPNAINFPVYEFEQMFNSFISNLPNEINIITYCNDIDCPMALELAEKLYYSGLSNILYMKEGILKWKESGYPLETQK